MNEDQTNSGAARAAQLAAMLRDLLMAEAARLARRGRWAEAEMAVGAVLALEPSGRAEALDLLARMWAQQGRSKDAAAAWTEALALEPGNAAYAGALRQVSRSSALRARAWLVPLLGAAAVGLIVALCVGACRFCLSMRASQTPGRARVTQGASGGRAQGPGR